MIITEDQLAELFKAKREQLLALIRIHLGSKLEQRIGSEDLLHDAFLRACNRKNWLTNSDTTEHLAQKLDRIVFEQTIDRIRKELGASRNADRDHHFPEESVAQLAMGLYGSLTTPSKALARKELIALVRSALDQLEPIDKMIVMWRIEFELSYKVIGQIIEPAMAENTVNKRCLRAFEKLGKLLPPVESFY